MVTITSLDTGALVTTRFRFGPSRPWPTRQTVSFDSSGSLEGCFLDRLDRDTIITSDRAWVLLSALFAKFQLIRASIDQGVPRARVAEMLAEAQVLTLNLGAESVHPDLLDSVRQLVPLYAARNLIDADARLDEARLQDATKTLTIYIVQILSARQKPSLSPYLRLLKCR